MSLRSTIYCILSGMSQDHCIEAQTCVRRTNSPLNLMFHQSIEGRSVSPPPGHKEWDPPKALPHNRLYTPEASSGVCIASTGTGWELTWMKSSRLFNKSLESSSDIV
ncbi:hypothetical protein SNOG_13291 [Parastagonospora nodorum SN15]|uniref:Uncharacterized protein n=1 Tax=Phaeosphaeria nodorum (strain SN15 / ATCC MYA-4574 / FGSC 10173) TaxID=321614 RepID=Q0U4M3_PHANO|nr:hypothetical protein SNOG_13291 [Parastagonospora nodorum SN15]EAT79175.1 hypothetical protein SNOG_13291 [Parastagonospora nodorum SN15]